MLNKLNHWLKALHCFFVKNVVFTGEKGFSQAADGITVYKLKALCCFYKGFY